MKRILIITGGQSSGKSEFAERLALNLDPNPVYVATARTEGMSERIEHHRKRRSEQWTTIEKPLKLNELHLPDRTILVECVTLWLSNLMMEFGNNALETFFSEFHSFTAPDATYIFVTNEVGLGGVAANDLARDFADLQGRANQFIAARADEVTLVVSGIAMKLK